MTAASILDFSAHFTAPVRAGFALNPAKLSRADIAFELGLPAEKLAIPEQIHSTAVKFAIIPGCTPGADGLVTNDPDILLTLKVADCVPLYLFEPYAKLISLVHSGWRGTVGNIADTAIEFMKEKGAETVKIQAFLGPAICICCYEVCGEVAKHFAETAKVKVSEQKWKVGLREQISLQLAATGVQKNNIHSPDICTYESSNCQSYRRDGKDASRMFAFMGLK